MEKRIFGLLGKSLSHSFSKNYFTQKFNENEDLNDCIYRNFELDSLDEIEKLLLTENLVGFNVTIPYKEEIIPFLDQLSPIAKEVGAVNTVTIKDERLTGYNTDVLGFDQSLGDRTFQNALILGTGGASKAISYVLQSRFIPTTFVSRESKNHTLSYEQLSKLDLSQFDLIVNTTPLGMYPNVDECPDISYAQLSSKHLLYDLVYNPIKSLFLELGENNGVQIKNGLTMLEFQAEAAWDIWNNQLNQ